MSPRNAAQNEVPCSESEEAMEGEAAGAGNSGSSSSSTPATSPPPHQEPPPSLPPPGAPDVLPLDHTLPDLLRQVSGTEALPAVRELKLRVIARESSLQRLSLYVPKLRELNLDGSCLSSLRDLGCGLGSLQLLRLAGCGLDSLDGTSGLPALRELHAPNNRVSDVRPAAFLPRLRVLDLRRNVVRDLGGVGFLGCCRRLHSLQLAGNPAAAANTYRRDVASLLPSLTHLDGLPLHRQDGDSDEHRDSGCDGDSDAGGDCAVQVGSGGGGGEGDDESQEPQEGRTDPTCGAEKAPVASRNVTSQRRQTRGSGGGARPQSVALSASSGGCQQPSSGHATAIRARRRPASAAPCLPTYQRLTDEAGVAAADGDSPSALTSGGVVCGNLAAALCRRRRAVRSAWQEKPVMGSSAGAEAAAIFSPKAGGLLEASRRWRQLYASYRSQHREQWQKEAQEEADSVASVSTSASASTSASTSASSSAATVPRVGGGVGGMLGCMAQEETLRPCCAAMAAAYAATPAHWRRRAHRSSSPTGSD